MHGKMNLGLCIANLLRRYRAVEVPGIGVFRVTRVPASYDEERSVLLPPASHVELTEGGADFSILTYLQVQRGVTSSVASGMLEKAVAETMEAITRNGRALLDGLGYLLADGASFVFKPFEVDGKGRKPVSMPPPPKAVEEKRTDTGHEEQAEAVDSEEKVSLEVTEPDIVEGQPNRHTLWWVVAVASVLVLLAIGGAWFYRPAWFGGAQTTQSQGGNPGDGSEPGRPDRASIGAVDSATLDSAQSHVQVVDSVPVDSVPATTPPSKPSVTYEIIVGSFATMAQADKFVAEMKAKGYDLHALDSRMPGNRKKISWGSFATEEEAYRELARVQKNFEPGAWIAKVEHE